MDFSSAINKIMPDVNSGSKEPFIIYRDQNGGWHCDYTQNQYGERFDWVEVVKGLDHLALEYKGADFSKGSFPFVYDAVLCNRIRAEYQLARSSGKDDDAIHALTCFFNDNVGEFSHNVTDYLTTLDRPLAALNEMCPISMATDNEDWVFNEDLASDAISHIENAVHDRLHKANGKTVLTSAHCIDNSGGADFTGLTLVVKADALMPEYRDAESQIVKCTHGNGARPNAIGQSIFCKELASDKTVVYYRHEIEGIAKIENLPDWAVKKIALAEALKEPGVFAYGGYYFKPYRQFRKGEVTRRLAGDSRPWKTDVQYEMRNMRSDHELGLSKYGWKKAGTGYSHEGFYAASGNSDADIFICIENGKRYVPYLNELFQYNEPPMKTKQTSKKPSLLGRLGEAKTEAAARNAERRPVSKAKKDTDREVS